MKKQMRRRGNPLFAGRERGSALLMGLMVMVGLSLLGLGFVAVSQTESAISINERNGKQAQDVAEAGAKIIVEWYQSPTWATNNALMPASTVTAFKVDRMVDFGSGVVNIGKYKPAPGTPPAFFCCDRPFKPRTEDRLWGTENTPDVQIDRTTTAGQTFLDALNTALFPDSSSNMDTARITDIRIYAPPIINGRINANGFYDAVTPTGTGAPMRYGLATIRVTATKTDRLTGRVAGQRSVKMVISEYPFPGPQGPVQSNANISTGGNMIVHWGKMTSQGTMYVKRPLVGLPWFDAYTRLPIDNGYDSCTVWKAPFTYRVGDVVCPTPTKIAAAGALSNLPRCAYTVLTAGSYLAGATEPSFEANTNCTTITSGAAFTDGTVQYKPRPRPISTIDPSSTIFSEQYPWLNQVLGKSIEDPWIEVRARGAITNAILASSTPDRTGYFQPFKYNATTQVITDTPDIGWSNWFELQTVSLPREQQQVTFPRIDYDFWKQVAKTGRGTTGVYYLQWVSGDTYTDGASTKTFREWTDTLSGAQAGFYFFDTTNSQNPQITGANNLTPIVQLNGGDWNMSGFIYLNAESFKTTGVQGAAGRYNFPGEPFQDVGYYDVDASGNYIWNGSAWTIGPPTGQTSGRSDGNGRWDYKDVNGNGKFDLHLTQKTVYRPDGSNQLLWVPDPYVPGCVIGDNTVVTATCSEPHEPYLNLQYPSDACCTGASGPNVIPLGWEDPTTQTRRPKKRHADDTLPTVNGSDICTTTADFDEFCTSNGYDRDGYMDYWSGAQSQPILNGVFYNEGTFTSTGNARLFGSVLINGDVDPTGTNEVWFDERLIKSDWPPKEWPFPRVIVTAVQTDPN